MAALLDKLNKVAKKIKDFKRLSIKYNASNYRQDKLDLRLRFEMDTAELVLKIGQQSAVAREELAVSIDPKSFQNMARLLKHLNFSEGIVFWRNTTHFLYKDVIISIVEVPNYGYYFELELVGEENLSPKLLDRLNSVKRLFGLKEFPTELDYYNFLDDLDKNSNLNFDGDSVDFDKLLDPNDKIWSKKTTKEFNINI